MRSVNNIHVFIVALIVTAQATSSTIGRGSSYTYDPNSIIQNERILRLFLGLASETAGRLIRLKNEARQRHDSTTIVNSNEPALRIQLSDLANERKIINHQKPKETVKSYEENPEPKTYEKKLEFPDKSAEIDQHVEQSNNNGNQREINSNNPKNTTDSKNVTEDSTNLPVEIESRMMFNVEKNNYISHEHLQTISNADTRITSIEHLPFSKQSIISDTTLWTQPNHETIPFMTNFTLPVNSKVLDEKSKSRLSSQDYSTSIKQPVTVESNVQKPMDMRNNQQQSLISDIRINSSVIPAQTGESAQNLQSEAKDKISKVLDSASIGSMINRATNQESNVTKHVPEVTRTLVSLVTSLKNENKSAGISDSTLGQESDILGKSKTMIQELGTSGSIGPSEGGRLHQVVANVTSQLPISAVSSNLGKIQDSDSQILGSAVNENLANRMIGTVSDVTNDKIPKNLLSSGPLQTNELNESIKNLNNLEMNQRSLLAPVANHTVSEIGNVSSDTLSTLLRNVGNNGAGVIEKIHDPKLSLAKTSTGQIGKIVTDLADTGTRQADSLIRENAGGTIDNIGKSVKIDNPVATVLGTNDNGISAIGSRLMGSLPIFRAFPSSESESSRGNDSTGTIIGEKESLGQSKVVRDDNSTGKFVRHDENPKIKESGDHSLLLEVELQNYDNDGTKRVTELDLHDFANKFVDALRPVDSGQKDI